MVFINHSDGKEEKGCTTRAFVCYMVQPKVIDRCAFCLPCDAKANSLVKRLIYFFIDLQFCSWCSKFYDFSCSVVTNWRFLIAICEFYPLSTCVSHSSLSNFAREQVGWAATLACNDQGCDICIFFVRIRRLFLTWSTNDILMLR